MLRELAKNREPATSLALFRIALCVCLLLNLWRVWHAGLLEALWLDASDGGLFPLLPFHWLVQLLGGPSREVTALLYHGTVLLACASLVGLGGGLTLLFTQQTFTALRLQNTMVSGGYDTLISNGLLLLAASRSTRTLSLDCWLKRRRWTSTTLVPAWPRYLLIFQLVFTYTLTGWQKVGWSWTPMGGYWALYYVLNDPTWTRFGSAWTPDISWLLRAATAVAVHWEQLAPLLLLGYLAEARRGEAWARWFPLRRIRASWVAVGVLLHLGIFGLLDVGPFSWVTLSYYIVLFAPREWQNGLTRLTRYPRTAGRLESQRRANGCRSPHS